jgi:hypothetical protein
MICAKIQNVGSAHDTSMKDFDVGQFGNHVFAVIPHTNPVSKARKCGFIQQAATKFIILFCQRDVITPLTKGKRRFKSRRTSTNDKYFFSCVFDGNTRGIPAAPPFLAHCGVLRTAQMHGFIIGCAADIASNALADFIFPALIDFIRQKRISNGGPCRTNEILDAALDLAHHGIRRGEAANTHNRFAGEAFDESNMGFLKTLGAETRRLGIIAEASRHIHIPEIRQFRQHCDNFAPLTFRGNAFGTMQLVNREPRRNFHRRLLLYRPASP